MKKLNVAYLNTLKNTFARLSYKGDYKLVKKARSVNEVLAKYLADNGVNVAEVGSSCPFSAVQKQSEYTISLGGSLRYKHKTELACKRNGVDADYHVDKRDLGMFPIYGELLYCKNDLSELYIRAYQVGIPSPKFYANGTEINKASFAQWATSDDYKKLSGLETTEAVVGDIDGNIIYAQDENGNLVFDKNGEPKTIALPPLRAIKLSNCKIFIKGENIIEKMFLDEDWSEAELNEIKTSFYAKFNG
jgi:hypothetical protein